jgi:hypothetical protein
MHDRPPARHRKRETKRERRRLAQRAYRRRFDDGRFTVVVEVDAGVVEMLVASHWLAECECSDRRKIGMAITGILAEAAKR